MPALLECDSGVLVVSRGDKEPEAPPCVRPSS
jgi:hypothetical protein